MPNQIIKWGKYKGLMIDQVDLILSKKGDCDSCKIYTSLKAYEMKIRLCDKCVNFDRTEKAYILQDQEEFIPTESDF